MTFTFYVELALGANLSSPIGAYSWTDVTQYVGLPSISITRGRGDRYAQTSPDRCALTFLNTGGRFVPRNPLGPYYGQLTRNTPLRVMVRPNTNNLVDTFTRTSSSSWGTADSGGAWTVVGTAADYSVSTTNGGRHTHPSASVRHTSLQPLSIIRSDQTVKIRANALSTGAAQSAGLILRYVDANNNRRGELQFATSGAITVRAVARDAGVDTVTASSPTGLTHSTSTWYWLRVQTFLTNVRMKVWADGTAEPSTWQITGAGNAFLSPVTGTLGCTSIRETGNTNASATIDFDSYSMVDGPRIQFTGFVEQWPVRWADSALTQAYAPITATGQLRRAGQMPALRSAIFRANTADYLSTSANVIAYWPMEDRSSAKTFASGVGGKAFGFTDMRLASNSTVVGSDPLPVVGGTGRVQFTVPPYPASTTWAVRFLFSIPSSPAASAQLLSWSTPGGTFARWQLTLFGGSPDTVRLEGYNSAGTATFIDTSINMVDLTSGAELTNGRQLYFEVNGTQNGANIDLNWNVWYAPDSDSSNSALGTGNSASVAGTLANVTLFSHDASSGLNAGGHTIGHIAVGTSSSIGAGANGATGGAGDTTDIRFVSLAVAQGIDWDFGDLTNPFAVSTQKMGAERVATTLDQLREVEATEIGVLYDGKQGSLTMLPRLFRQNHAVNLTLDVNAGQVGWPLEPTDDDFLLRNDVTVSNVNGSFYRSTDSTSVQAQGVHADSVQVNTYRDVDLQDHAAWRKNVGISNELRYPAVVIDLTRNYLALADAWCDCDIGSRIQITNIPDNELPPDTLDLILEGYTEEISSTEWKVVANTSTAKPWNVIKLDDTSLARLDQSGSTLTTNYSAGATSMVVACTGALWSTTAVPYDINIAGERVTVTAVSGAASPQTLTVTRAVNGVAKAQTSGATVRLWSTGVLAA